jgi:hypothetical protein
MALTKSLKVEKIRLLSNPASQSAIVHEGGIVSPPDIPMYCTFATEIRITRFRRKKDMEGQRCKRRPSTQWKDQGEANKLACKEDAALTPLPEGETRFKRIGQ